MIYLSTAIGLTPGGSSTINIYTYTHTIHRTIHRTTQITTNLQECGPCPVFASFALAFALQLRKTRKNLSQGSRRIPTCYKTHTHTHYYDRPYSALFQKSISYRFPSPSAGVCLYLITLVLILTPVNITASFQFYGSVRASYMSK